MEAKLRCVVIDDDTDYLQEVRRCFAASCLNYEVVAFSDSIEAVEYIRRVRVDMILTAYLVPQIDGLQLISLVRSFNLHVPIVMLSHVPMQALALARGASAFLAKADLWAHFAPKARKLSVPRNQQAA